MSRTIIKISIILLIIVSLPLGFYLTRELSTLNENEIMVERVFSTQLKSILLSLNQYSESLVSRWAQSVDQPVPVDGELMEVLIENLINNNRSIEAVQFYDLGWNESVVTYSGNGSVAPWFVTPSSATLKRLSDFLEINYQKVESLTAGDKVQLYFLLKNNEEQILCQLLIDPLVYIEQNLGSRIQQVTQDIFYLEINDTLANELIYSTEVIQEFERKNLPLQSTPLWYLPHYETGIRLKEKTVKELATERSQQSSYFLWGMALIVLVGLSFVIWNIRREMKLAELKSEFVSNVSHEIRTPLALISMYAETLMLKRIKTEEKQTDYLKTIHHESLRLTEIVNRILNFSRIEKNKRTYDFVLVDLNKFIPKIIHSTKNHLMANRIEYSFHPFEEDVPVELDKEAVSDMLINLINNAIKYGKEENKRVEIRILKRKKYVWLEVEDNGIGISAKNQKFIFDQFYRVTEGDLAQKAKGSGLGLNMVKKMMIAHGGAVAVRSKLGEGSTFILKFPIKRMSHV